MARTTTYTCDQCKQPISGLYGPLFVSIAYAEVGRRYDGDLCSWKCASEWFAERERDVS